MKHFLTILSCLWIITNHAHGQQTDSIFKDHKSFSLETFKVFMGPEKVEVKDLQIILNDLLLRDSAAAYPLLRQLNGREIKLRFYNARKSFKKFGVQSKIGILYCKTRGNVVIDMANQKIIRK